MELILMCVHNNDIITSMDTITNIITYYQTPSQNYQILVISDGATNIDSAYEQFCQTNGVTLIKSDGKKAGGMGGAWLKRNFEEALKLSFDYLLQIEPDVWIRDKFYLPSGITDSGVDFVGRRPLSQTYINAFMCYKRATIEQIINSNALDDSVFENKRFNYKKYNGPALVSNDRIITKIIKDLNLNCGEDSKNIAWIYPSGFKIKNKRVPAYALIHPNPNI